jgi:MFS family permease
LGAIGGAGFSGFCFGIVVGGVVCDKIGYGKLVMLAFVCHVLSAFVTFGASGPENAYNMLFWGMFIFAYANGTLEAVANPLVATLFPTKRTHYLNILHASWPAGLILGGIVGWVLDDKMEIGWKVQLSLYLIPTVAYGVMFFGQSYPKSEASEKGLSLGEMFKDVGILGGLVVCYLLALFFSGVFEPMFTPADASAEQAAAAAGKAKTLGYVIGGILLIAVGIMTRFSLGAVLLFVLFVVHAMVGAVELGTDGWIQNITGNILSSEQGKILFVWTSSVMFALRFCAHWIEKNLKLSPIGLLFVCAVLAVIGLNLTSIAEGFVMAMLALTVYAVGKTFFWPTMLAVASDRYPRSGAVAISIMGGIGMMSAGLIGSPGLGYAKDRFAGEALAVSNSSAFESYRAAKPSEFLIFAPSTGLDGKKLGDIQGKVGDARAILGNGSLEPLDEAKLAALSAEDREAAENKQKQLEGIRDTLDKAGVLKPEGNSNLDDGLLALTDVEKDVFEASIAGDRKTLKADSVIPAFMAAIYLFLMFYFKSIGGYKPETIDPERLTGGNEGPGEA